MAGKKAQTKSTTSLDAMPAAVVEVFGGEVVFDGRYDECVAYLRDRRDLAEVEAIAIRFVNDRQNAILELGVYRRNRIGPGSHQPQDRDQAGPTQPSV